MENIIALELEDDADFMFSVAFQNDSCLLMAAALVAACKSSGCEDDRSGTTVRRYFEETIPQYSPSEFIGHFRMSREAVQVNMLNSYCAKFTYGDVIWLFVNFYGPYKPRMDIPSAPATHRLRRV